MSEGVLRKAKRWKTVFWISIFGIIVPLVVGTFGTVAGMIRAFESMSVSGGSNPGDLADDIRLGLISTAGGIVISFLFLVALIVSIMALKKLKSSQNNFQHLDEYRPEK